MWTVSFTFLAAAGLAAVLTPLVRDAAVRRGLGVLAPTSRSVHTRPITRLGGVAVVAAFYLPLLAVTLTGRALGPDVQEDIRLALGLLGGGLAIAALGVYDDVAGASARLKLAVQLSVAAAVYAAGFRIDAITSPWGGPLHLGWLGLPFTMLWIAGVVNAVNLIDGLDGLASGVALFAVATTSVTAVVSGDGLMLLASAATAGALLGFLRYNFNPATVFLGDTGSMFVGFVLAVTAIHTHVKASAAVALAVPLIALGVPIADTLLAIGRRTLRGAPVFGADRGHIHHRLLERGLSHRQAVLALYGSASVLAAAALLLTLVNSTQGFLLLVVLALTGLTGLRALGYFDLARTGEVLALRRRTVEGRQATRGACGRLRRATTAAEVEDALRVFATGQGACAVGLDPGAHPGWAGQVPWSEQLGPAAPAHLLRVRFPLRPDCDAAGQLELAFADGRQGLPRDAGVAVEQLRDALVEALDRLAAAGITPGRAAWPAEGRRGAG